jgi:hypothetical protein
MEVVDNFTLADSVIGKHFLLIQNLFFWMLEQRIGSGFATLNITSSANAANLLFNTSI